jgi:hypothetical protein
MSLKTFKKFTHDLLQDQLPYIIQKKDAEGNGETTEGMTLLELQVRD